MSMPRGSVTLDTSAMIEYFTGTKLGRAVKDYLEALKPEEKVYCSIYSISEIFYVLCRLMGPRNALDKITDMNTYCPRALAREGCLSLHSVFLR